MLSTCEFYVKNAGLLYTVFILKETRRPNRYHMRFQAFAKMFKIHHVGNSCRAMVKNRPGYGRLNPWLLFAAFLIDF